MKVSVSVFGRFHFFDLAKQLNDKRLLFQLVTTYPKFKVREWGVNKKIVIGIVVLELCKRVFIKLNFYRPAIEVFLKKTYGLISLRSVSKNTDIFIFLAGNGFNSRLIKKLQRSNVVCIADEASSHVLIHEKILSDEYKELGIKNNKKHAKEIVKETLLEYHLADYITVPSSFVKRSMNEAGINPEKIFVNPYGVDLSQFKQIPKQDNIFRVIFCGNLSIQKGSHYLLQSIYELNLEDFECWHIGKISSEMEVFIKKYRTKKMKYKGVQPQSELYKLYSQGSVFCMPSLQEGMAMVQLQAMACGLPLICTTNTGGDDLITADGKEGFVIPVKSVDSIKEKINYLYKNRSECREMGLKARQRVSKGFTWNDYGDRYTLFLESVINK